MKRQRYSPTAPVCRIGKIASLPFEVRMELNRRIRDGIFGDELLSWLNGLPVVKERLAARFKGRRINAENLSNWRAGGYAEWLQAGVPGNN